MHDVTDEKRLVELVHALRKVTDKALKAGVCPDCAARAHGTLIIALVERFRGRGATPTYLEEMATELRAMFGGPPTLQ